MVMKKVILFVMVISLMLCTASFAESLFPGLNKQEENENTARVNVIDELTQNIELWARTNRVNVYLRLEPSQLAEYLGILQNEGEPVWVEARVYTSENMEWYKIVENGVECYIRVDLLDIMTEEESKNYNSATIPADRLIKSIITPTLVPTTLTQESQALPTLFPSSSKEITEETSVAPVITPAPTVALAEGICHYCGGLGECSYCFGLGDCEHCFGEGTTLCETCFGSGDCQTCYGYGYNDRFVPSKGIEHIKCNRCSGNGKCTRCGGYGSIKCNYCGGSGACTYCKGTKQCQYCGGTGRQ